MPKIFTLIATLVLLNPVFAFGAERNEFPVKAPRFSEQEGVRLKSNLLLWAATIPNLGLEATFNKRWSTSFDVWYSPWKLSEKLSVKTVAILPAIRWWVKSNQSGSFLNVHFNIAWFNVRANAYRYQDSGRPLLGAGIGYGYRLRVNNRWGFEFEIGGGFADAKYNRYYNVENGALIDTKKTMYWGIDRASVTVTCNL